MTLELSGFSPAAKLCSSPGNPSNKSTNSSYGSNTSSSRGFKSYSIESLLSDIRTTTPVVEKKQSTPGTICFTNFLIDFFRNTDFYIAYIYCYYYY